MTSKVIVLLQVVSTVVMATGLLIMLIQMVVFLKKMFAMVLLNVVKIQMKQIAQALKYLLLQLVLQQHQVGLVFLLLIYHGML